MAEKCSSCQTDVTNDKRATKFRCPSCGKSRIIRCFHCRELGTRYKCPDCGFEGPN